MKHYTVNTVCGLKNIDELGFTLIHEHIICVAALMLKTFPNFFDYHKLKRQVIDKLREANEVYGVETLVDGTPFQLGRDVELIQEISEQSGVNIIVSTGYYTPYGFGFNIVPIDIQAQYFAEECRNGIEKSSIRPAMLKSASMKNDSDIALQVMAETQKLTDLPLFLHSDSYCGNGIMQAEILKKANCDMSKIIIGHVGDTMNFDYVEKILQYGCFVSLDRIARASDAERKSSFYAEAAMRFGVEKLFFSHDCILYPIEKNSLQSGDPKEIGSLLSINKFLIPELRKRGFSDKELHQLFVENPRKLWKKK